MDFGKKIEELKMTTDEVNRFCKAMKDEKFRQMFHDYAEEISNPANKKKYEEEIVQLEQERGVEVKFIHPTAHHVTKTKTKAGEKLFINICSNNLINKPTCESRKNENGQAGLWWSLPYILTPGRPDRDAKGNMCKIYDVIFHPDTLHMADRNTRFMQLVNSTAAQGIEDAFQVKMDQPKVLKMKYKGVPQPTVIRKPIPGYSKKDESCHHDDPLCIQDPTPIKDIKLPSPSIAQIPNANQSSSPHIQPHYTIKYRSLVDLQDYQCSRYSTPGIRPKEIVITIDLPLLESTAGVDLNIMDRKLVLDSQKPDYRLEIKLAYAVDEDKGHAKFNKAKKQLTVTLPVQPDKNEAIGLVDGNWPESFDVNKMRGSAKADDAELFGDEHSQQDMSEARWEAQPKEIGLVQEKPVEEHGHVQEEPVQKNWDVLVESGQENGHVQEKKEQENKDVQEGLEKENGNVLQEPVQENIEVPEVVTQITSTNLESENRNQLQSKNKPLHLARADICEVSNSETSRPLENGTRTNMSSLPGAHECTKKMFLEPHANEDDKNDQDKKNLPSDTRLVQPLLLVPNVQLEAPVVELQIEEIQNSPSNPSNFISGKIEEEPRLVNDRPNTDTNTSAALYFQNSLWFELD